MKNRYLTAKLFVKDCPERCANMAFYLGLWIGAVGFAWSMTLQTSWGLILFLPGMALFLGGMFWESRIMTKKYESMRDKWTKR